MEYMIAIDPQGAYYLAHHGIKGQKWGIRRFQNSDGSWTDEGKARYGSGAYKRQLNKLDKQVAEEVYKKAAADKRIDKYDSKLNKLNKKGKLTDKKKSKLMKKAKKYVDRSKSSEELIKEGQSRIEKTLKSAKKNGYTVKSVDFVRDMNVGRGLLADLVVYSAAKKGNAAATTAAYHHDKKRIGGAERGFVNSKRYNVRKAKAKDARDISVRG